MSTVEREAALANLDEVVRIRATTAKKLREEAKAARQAGDQAKASALAREATGLNQQNFRILHVRRKLRAGASVQESLQKLRAITREAAEVEEQIQRGAELLERARTLVQIIVRLSDIFS